MNDFTTRRPRQDPPISLAAQCEARAQHRSDDPHASAAESATCEPPLDLLPSMHNCAVERVVRGWVSGLSKRERDVIEGHFGSHEREPETLDMLSSRLGLDFERVQEIQNEALLKVKRCMLRERYRKAGLSLVSGARTAHR